MSFPPVTTNLILNQISEKDNPYFLFSFAMPESEGEILLDIPQGLRVSSPVLVRREDVPARIPAFHNKE